jgi:hypothetical protein
VKEAVANVLSGKMSMRTAAEKCVERSSLQVRVSLIRKGNECKLLSKLGRLEATFSVTLEHQLAEHVKVSENRLMGLTRKEFLKVAFDLAEALGTDHRFNKQKKICWKGFLLFPHETKSNLQVSREKSGETAAQVQEMMCIICAETIDENWIQCCTYQGWAHEECSRVELDDIYLNCDICIGKGN